MKLSKFADNMPFIEHTLNWQRGELFEMNCVAVVGASLICLSMLVWRYAAGPVAQALPVPLLLVALIFFAATISGHLSSGAKVKAFQNQYNENPATFVYAERERIASFDAVYKYTIIGVGLAFAIAIGLFVLSEKAIVRAIAAALVLLGLSGLVIDMFSHERANKYSSYIEQEITRIEARIND